MSRSVVTLAYLDWVLRAVGLGVGVWLLCGVMTRLDQMQSQRAEQQAQQQVEAVATPSPSPVVDPSPVATPVLSPLAVEVSSWDGVTVGLWQQFCQQTRNGLGYSVKEQGICRALAEAGQ